MSRTPREIVRTAVGIATVAPALGLLVLAVVLMAKGTFGGVLSGLFVALVAVALLFVALMMTHAPVTIHQLLRRSERDREEKAARDAAGAGDPAPRDHPIRGSGHSESNGHGPHGPN